MGYIIAEDAIVVEVKDHDNWREVARFPGYNPISVVDAESCMRGVRRSLLEGEQQKLVASGVRPYPE